MTLQQTAHGLWAIVNEQGATVAVCQTAREAFWRTQEQS